MKLSIIICTYKRPALLKACLSGALPVLDAIDSEVIVVNDSKTDAVNVPVHPRVRLLNSTKQGVASARNLGAHHALGDVLLFVDDDIEFSLHNVQQLLEEYAKREPACYNPNWRYPDAMYAAISNTQFGRFLIRYKLVNYKGWVPDLNWQDQVFEAPQLAAFFMLMPKALFSASGGFNESFTNQGTEDDELCRRLAKMNVKMFVDPQNYVFHNEMDRVTLKARIGRYYNGAANRRNAFELGDASYALYYAISKKMMLHVLLPLEPLLFAMARHVPNKKTFDFLYFKMANVLIALAIYRGYTKR